MDKIRNMLKSEKIAPESRWYHQQKRDIAKLFNKKGVLSKMKDEVRSNLCYSLQHLEFLDILLRDLVLDEVLQKKIRQTFIIETMAIVEIVLSEVLDFNGVPLKRKNLNYYIKSMKQSNFLELSKEEFTELDVLRKLRNRVHPSNLGDDGKSNWYTFEEVDYKKAKKSLHTILCNSKLDNESAQKYIEFLVKENQ